MDEPRPHEPFYVLATSSRLDDRTRVLKQDETFAVFDRSGDMHPVGLGEQGLFHRGTRYLHRLQLLLQRRRPLLLSSTISDEAVLAVDLANTDQELDGQVSLPRNTIHVFRSCFLWEGACYLRLRLRNYSLRSVPISIALLFEADFRDIFEVRGVRRKHRGELRAPDVTPDRVELAYAGLDGVERRTRLTFLPAPGELSSGAASLALTLPPHGEHTQFVTIECDPAPAGAPRFTYESAFAQSCATLAAMREADAAIDSSNEEFDEWIYRSSTDLRMMTTRTPGGPYPYAGVPWFSTVFGRDGIVTALEWLWLNPQVARGVLTFLAEHQAREHDPERDAEPGKILHELRDGEMAALGEVPFARYYGSVDATPLFVVLAGAYHERTADLELAAALWPAVERAIAWMQQDGDPDHDGFVEYQRRSTSGLVAQGWKDSSDSVFHADGTLAEGPIALCEVQAYAYLAFVRASELARALGKHQRAEELLEASRRLRERFEKAFWCEDLSTYALALDGAKRPCRVVASNAGQCLFTGIADRERARRTAETLLGDASYSGWGIRTLSANEVRYNPMAYHNGSVWPHDNALIALGFARYGLKASAARVLDGMFASAHEMDLKRLPELFCGFERRAGEGPTLYPVACAPQAWSAGAAYLLLQASLGLTIDAPRRQVRFEHPALPPAVSSLTIRNLRVRDATVDLLLRTQDGDVGVNLLRRRGDVEIVTVK